MMRSLLLTVSVLGIGHLFASPAFADLDIALVGRASTQGLGGELVVPVIKQVNLRGGVYRFNLKASETAAGIDYDLEAKLFSWGGYVDWHLFESSFRLSAGTLIDENTVLASNKPTQVFKVGPYSYSASQIGQLDGRITVDRVAPYLGIGWGNPVRTEKRVSLLFDAGIMFHGQPQAELTASIPDQSPLNYVPKMRARFERDLAKEVSSFQQDIGSFRYYPVASLGLAYRF